MGTFDNNENEPTVQYRGPIARDESINLSELMKAQKDTDASLEEEEVKDEAPKTPEEKEELKNALAGMVTTAAAPKQETPKKSPLQIAKERKETQGSGMVLNNADIAAANNKKLKNFANNDRREKEFEDYKKEQDMLAATAKEVHVHKDPTTQIEHAEMMDELEYAQKKHAAGEKIGTLKYLTDEVPNQKIVSINKNEDVVAEADDGSDPEADEAAVKALHEKEKVRKDLIEIIIDKTGLGYDNIEFTDDEKEKIRRASEIKLTEVETLELKSMKVVAPTKSFLDTIVEHTPTLSGTMISLPGSRYRVNVNGLSYGELGDVVLSDETRDFDKIHKQYSVIYNALGTPSIGKFANFEDFLRNTAFTDMDLLLYGLIVATFPEIETIPLNCRKCNRTFTYEYTPRTLLDLENCSDAFLQNMKAVTDCSPVDATSFNEESFLKKRKLIKLPISGYVIEMGLASAYDYLYEISRTILDKNFKDEHPDDVNGIMQFNVAFLTMVRSIYVPSGDAYIQYTNTEDILQALYRIKVDEFPIITNIVGKYTDEYTPQFSFKNVQCPNCGTVTQRVGADLNSLVFRKYQLLLSTEINVENIL